ncbi:hypothetical protein AB0L71_18630 [Streptomyces sp. NPDC052052]|uniref:hypothetical protein n=1 Tax=Streptomyces sp. NPDC052052 TaxID=3154756 RepID=UPI003415D7B7
MGIIGRGPVGSVIAFAVLVGTASVLTGCSGEAEPASAGPSASPSPSRSVDASPAHTADRVQYLKGETTSQAPKPVDDQQVLLSVASRKGSAELPLDKEVGVGGLDIQVNCQGTGTLRVTVEAVGLSFPMECVDTEVSSISNEIKRKSARGKGSVRVTAPSTVRWSLTVSQ